MREKLIRLRAWCARRRAALKLSEPGVRIRIALGVLVLIEIVVAFVTTRR